MLLLWKTILLGIVEGLTEFLPVSSTGHLLVVEQWLNIDMDSAYWKMFTIVIQLGAIFAVVVYFWGRIMALLRGKSTSNASANLLDAMDATKGIGVRKARSIPPIMAIIVGTIPVLIVGYATHKYVEEHLEKPKVIAIAEVVGAFVILAVEMMKRPVNTPRMEDLTFMQSLGIGITQILAAVFPGTSRSGATIIPGMAMGVSREAAAEFSFFLSIPAMFAAGGYTLLKQMKDGGGMTFQELVLLAVGTLISFLVAWVVIAAFMHYVRRNSFVPFAIYRLVFAAVVWWFLVMKH